MSKLKAYYAHCLAIYDTPQEQRDLETLAKLGFEVINPNTPEHTAAAKKIRVETESSEKVMEYFTDLVENNADIVVFRALPNGQIPAGVFKEVVHARKVGKPVIELPSNILIRQMSVEATREYLQEAGQR